MRLRNVTDSEKKIAKSRYICTQPEEYRTKWNSFFQNENPIHIEIGTGKGKFIIEMARRHPNVNYIGIERYSSVIYRAVQKIEKICLENERNLAEGISPEEEKGIPNLLLICMDAKDLEKVFGEEEVAKIYLNFSDPWPKERHAKRRLPSCAFLKRYEKILKKEGNLEFKTDNEKLFRFAEEELIPANWKKDQVTYDLHHDLEMAAGNVMTEYEEKFSALGKPIYKYVISRVFTKVADTKGEKKMELVFKMNNFEKEVLESDIPVVVDFYADWCGPCKMMAPVIAGLAEEYSDRCKVGKCNVDEEMELASRYHVLSIPTIIIFKNGEPRETIVGAVSKNELVGKLEQVLN